MLNVSVRPQPAAVATASALAATAGGTSSDEILVEQIAAGSKPAMMGGGLRWRTPRRRKDIYREGSVADRLRRAIPVQRRRNAARLHVGESASCRTHSEPCRKVRLLFGFVRNRFAREDV